MRKVLATALLLVVLMGTFFGSGQALIRAGRNMIPNRAAEEDADLIYEMYDRAQKVPRYSKRGNS